MKCYKLYTQNKRKKWIEQLISEYFNSFTIYKATGRYGGIRERTLVIEIITNSPASEYKLDKIQKSICGYNTQDAVLIIRVS